MSYEQRLLRCAGRLDLPGWRLKRVEITRAGETMAEELREAAETIARRWVEELPLAEGGHGVGFFGVHQGEGADFAFLDRWANGNEIHHMVAVGPKHQPDKLADATPETGCVCVWDLHAQYRERQAWIETVMGPAQPDIEAYLAREWEEWV